MDVIKCALLVVRHGAYLLLASALPAAARYSGQELNVAKTPPLPSICWIVRAVREGAGVRVMFVPGAPSGGTRLQGRFKVGRDGITWIYGPKLGKTEPGLLLTKGESAGFGQGPENHCHFRVEKVNGMLGVTAHASFSPSEHPLMEPSEFIPAQ